MVCDGGGDCVHANSVSQPAPNPQRSRPLHSPPHTTTLWNRMLLDSCHVVLGILLSLLYAQEGAQVSLQASEGHT